MNTQTVTPETGQWWADSEGVVFVFGETNGKYTPVIHFIPGGRPWIDDYFDAIDFAGLVCIPADEAIERLQKSG